MVMKKLNKYELISYRKDLIILICDLEIIISKQENMVCYGQITENEAKENIKKFELEIQHNLNLIKVVENQLKIEFNITLKYDE